MLSFVSQHPGIRYRLAISTIVILVLVVVLEVLFASLFAGRVANGLVIYPLHHAEIFRLLWASNPGKTIEVFLMGGPLMVFEHRDSITLAEVWSIHIYFVDLLIHLGVALATGLAWSTGKLENPGTSRRLFLFGAVLTIAAIVQVKLAACCGAGPRWFMDTVLLSRVYDPQSYRFWSPVYEALSGLFVPLQWLAGISGIGLMFYAYTRRTTI